MTDWWTILEIVLGACAGYQIGRGVEMLRNEKRKCVRPSAIG